MFDSSRSAQTARLLLEHLQLDAAGVVDTRTILAWVGVGAEHHQPGEPVRTRLALRALASGQILEARSQAEIGCTSPGCQLRAAVVLPLQVRGRTVGALKLYRAADGQAISTASVGAAAGLARLFGVYLESADADTQATRVMPRMASARLAVEGGDHTQLVPIADIRFVSVRGHRVVVRTFDAEYRARHSLGELEALLAHHSFARVHRAFMVNLEHVAEVHPFFAGAYLLRMDDAERSEVPVSRAMAGRLRRLLVL